MSATCLAKTLRRIFFWMILVAGLSSLVTYHIGLLLPRLEINQSVNYVDVKVRLNSALAKEVNLEKTGIDDRRSQHPYRKLSQASDSKIQTSQISQILAKLKQIETKIQHISAYRSVLSLGQDKNHTQILKRVFSQHNYTVFSKDQNNDNTGNWSIIMTSNRTDDNNKQDYQKVNQIPILLHIIEQPGYMCHLHTVYSKITEEYNTSCYDFQTDIKTSPTSTFLLHSDKEEPEIKHWKDLNTLRYRGPLWQAEEILLTQNDHILHLKLTVLVASLFPLRIYVHSGLMLEKVKADLVGRYGEKAEAIWWRNLKQSIVVGLLTLENMAVRLDNHQFYKCWRCYQLLQLDVVFTSKFHPIITKVKPLFQTSSQEVLTDIAALMVTNDTVAMDIAIALGESSSNILLGKRECRKSFGICLIESDLVYLLENGYESKINNRFIKLYPSTSDDYTTIINKLQQLWMNDRSLKTLNQEMQKHGTYVPEFHTSPDVHSLLQQVESYISTNVDYTEENLLRSNLMPNSNFHRHLKSSDQKDYVSLDDQGDYLCSRDTDDIPLLSSLKIYPTVNQSFNPYQFIYNITVNYTMIVLRLHATTKGCLTEARFDNISGLVSHSNYTIGLGDNTMKIHVVDLSNRQPVIINTYTINISRNYGGQQDGHRSNSVLKTCVLKQDCSMNFLPGESCGLHPSDQYVTWNQFIAESNRKPYCNSYQDSIDADWKVPCRSCDNRNSCYWKQARWQPLLCQHRQHSFAEAKKCFKGKKVLFIGDSTNRGIMHYILEKINNTLSDWDKTHDLKLYTGINENQTTMSFAYYPQFWLPNDHRPGFDKAIYQLIKWTSPLENNSKTVMIVGGVHWLGKQHINTILSALRREGLTGIRLIMKGHGAGFHQHVEGVHFASLAHQQKLELQEREVSRFASRHGFHVVPTFNMTMSRYKDFLQGKCACHFHKVSMKTGRQGQKKYHIEGEINAAYSELVINRICQHQPG